MVFFATLGIELGRITLGASNFEAIQSNPLTLKIVKIFWYLMKLIVMTSYAVKWVFFKKVCLTYVNVTSNFPTNPAFCSYLSYISINSEYSAIFGRYTQLILLNPNVGQKLYENRSKSWILTSKWRLNLIFDAGLYSKNIYQIL